ncbi:MAG: 50S ribosomal protein L25/general stress protein Ctc [Bacteroidota bacterium]
MKSIDIKGSKRAEISKQEVKELRIAEKVPCVIYGGKEPVHFSADASAFKGLIYTPDAHLVHLDIDGTTFKTVLKEVQYHPVTDAIIHIDFLEISDNKPVTISVPVKFTGASEGVKQGGKLVAKMRKLKIEALPSKLPDDITIDISDLKIGGSVRIRDMKREGVTFLDTENNVIVGVRVTRNMTADETPAGGAATAAKAAAPAKAAAAPAK